MNQEILQDFLCHSQAQFSSKTIKDYNTHLMQFFSFCNKNYDDVTAVNVCEWLASMENNGLNSRVIQEKLSSLGLFYQYCMDEMKLYRNPSVKLLKRNESLHDYLIKQRTVYLQALINYQVKSREILKIIDTIGILSRADMLVGVVGGNSK